MSTPQPTLYYVYSADRHHVATYSVKEAADAHIASWPAAYVTTSAPSSTDLELLTGPSTTTTVA